MKRLAPRFPHNFNSEPFGFLLAKLSRLWSGLPNCLIPLRQR